MRIQPSERWVRALVGDTVVVDSRRPVLFWEDSFPVPTYAFEPADVRTELLVPAPAHLPSADPPTGFDFFAPHGPVVEMYDLVVAGRTLPRAAWRRDDPGLLDKLVVSWRPGLLDRWLEEDEEVHGHPRDPYKRVDALPSSRHVLVEVDGVVLAETRRPVLLFETGLPTRYYVPESDLRTESLVPTAAHSFCPYKGRADRYWGVRGRPDLTDIAWSYRDPFPAVGHIAGLVGFYNELVDLTVDGVRIERPETVFSRREHRPAGG